MNSVGRWCEEENEIEAIITEYFGYLFQSSNPDVAIIDEVLEAVEARVTPKMNDQMTTPFFPDEVISALNQMAPLKSHGPDGLPVFFFKNTGSYWVRILLLVFWIS